MEYETLDQIALEEAYNQEKKDKLNEALAAEKEQQQRQKSSEGEAEEEQQIISSRI